MTALSTVHKSYTFQFKRYRPVVDASPVAQAVLSEEELAVGTGMQSMRLTGRKQSLFRRQEIRDGFLVSYLF